MKTTTIEDLVRWAYLEELPKVAPGRSGPTGVGNGWGAVGSYVQLLAVIDLNPYGVVPNLADLGEPHPDAVAVHAAIADLDHLVVDDFDPEDLVSDMPHLGDLLQVALAEAIDRVLVRDRDGDLVVKGGVGVLVRTRALLGGAVAPVGDAPRLVPMLGANGRQVWRRRVLMACRWDGDGNEIGWETREVGVPVVSGRVPLDAFPVEVLRPDPTGLIAERLRWMAWHAGLEALETMLTDRLVDHRLVLPDRPWRPWAGDRVADRRVHDVVGWEGVVGAAGCPGRTMKMRRRVA